MSVDTDDNELLRRLFCKLLGFEFFWQVMSDQATTGNLGERLKLSEILRKVPGWSVLALTGCLFISTRDDDLCPCLEVLVTVWLLLWGALRINGADLGMSYGLGLSRLTSWSKTGCDAAARCSFVLKLIKKSDYEIKVPLLSCFLFFSRSFRSFWSFMSRHWNWSTFYVIQMSRRLFFVILINSQKTIAC